MRSSLVCLLAASLLSAQDVPHQIDKVFESYGAQGPGCTVGIARDGKPLYSKGYGMADLEHDVPLSPSSPFYMASVSKQFTAIAVLLLVEDGKIALTDPVRKFIPELPEYAGAITIRHLLTHTSGVRDYLTLGFLAGLSPDFVHTDSSFLHMISRQSALNFPPGSEFLYSNSGYVLLSLVVKNVTGKSLNEFAQERIFGPLGMKSTRFQHDHSSLVPGKAFGYERRGGLWHTANSMLDTVGDGGLYSTVEDMLRWAANFDNPLIGAAALNTMQPSAKLTNGDETGYGMGLAPGDYRGLPIVSHSGGLAGYRTQFLRFPAQRLSIVCLCNNGTANPGQLARRVAELYLGPEMKPPDEPAKTTAAAVHLTEQELQARAGLYRAEDRGYLEIVANDGSLHLIGGPALTPMDKQRFAVGGASDRTRVVFDAQAVPGSLELIESGGPAVRYERTIPVKLFESEKKAYVGEFESKELNAIYRISLVDNGDLSVEWGDRAAVRMQSSGPDRMRNVATGVEYVFVRDNAGRVTGFYLNAGRVRRIWFRKST